MNFQQLPREQKMQKPEMQDDQRLPVFKKKRTRRVRPSMLMGGALLTTLLIVGTFFVFAQLNQPDLTPKLLLPQDLHLVTEISAEELEAIGQGQGVTPPSRLSQPGLSTLPVTGVDGKPFVFYHGGEYCPFCAAERWSLLIALSQFGTFSNVSRIVSSEDQIATVTLTGSHYQSLYIDLLVVEHSQNPFDADPPMTQQEKSLLSTYDVPPYVSTEVQGKIPFVDIANQYLQAGASFDMQILLDRSWLDIAHSLHDSTSATAQMVLGAANYLTAAICGVTHNQPVSVCDRPSIVSILHGLSMISRPEGSRAA